MERVMKAGDLVKGSYFDVMLVEVINDERLHSDMEYCRASYDKHMFRDNSYEGRDFMTNNPDSCNAIIAAPEKHYMAKLVGDVWWWVNDCSQCCGHGRDWMGSECEKHNVCRTCNIHRSKLTDAPWGGKHGWQCKSCAEAEHEADKEAALSSMPDEYDEWDYHNLSEIKCPHCNYELSDSWESSDDHEEDHDCPRCDNVFTVTAEHSISFNCQRKDD